MGTYIAVFDYDTMHQNAVAICVRVSHLSIRPPENLIFKTIQRSWYIFITWITILQLFLIVSAHCGVDLNVQWNILWNCFRQDHFHSSLIFLVFTEKTAYFTCLTYMLIIQANICQTSLEYENVNEEFRSIHLSTLLKNQILFGRTFSRSYHSSLLQPCYYM